jgi:hypothetical protein
MNPLDEKIAAWRNQMAKTLPLPEETVGELEDHLREQIAELMRDGMAMDEAFDAGRLRLGKPRELAAELFRSQPGWFGAAWMKDRAYLLLFGVVAAAFAGAFWWGAGRLFGSDGGMSIFTILVILSFWLNNQQLHRRIAILTAETIRTSTARQEKRGRLGFLRLIAERAEHGAKPAK